MVDTICSSDNVATVPAATTTVRGQPLEQLQVEAEGTPHEEIQYPTGAKLWLNMASILMVSFLHGLDLTIVAVAVPSLTNQFKTVEDIGCFGKLYTLFDLKRLYVAGVIIFESGSLLCTIAPTSRVFILGRAVAGFGAAAMVSGASTIIPRCFPNEKRALMNGFVGFAQSFGLVSAPIIGGALVDAFTWRACFGINLPMGAVAVLIAIYGLEDPLPNSNLVLPFREKIRRLDLIGTAMVIPSTVCLLTGLQWGGIKYGWSDWRIILLLAVSATMFVCFGYIQHRQQEKAILPPRIVRKRTVLACALFCGCCNGTLAVTEYYISIYFQGVRGYTAVKSGLLGLPMIVGLAVASIFAAVAITRIGYYTPFMFATSVLAPIASGLLTTLDLDDSPVKVAALLGFLGAAVGFGIQSPSTAIMTVLSPQEVSIGLAINMFAAGLGSSLFVAASSTLFQQRLNAEVTKYAPDINATAFGTHGLSDIRKYLGPDRLKNVLLGYDQAVVQTLYLPLGLTLLTIVGSVFTEIRSVKKKQA